MKTDPRHQILKYSLKRGISSIFGVSLLSFGAALYAQDLAPRLPINTSQASVRENPKPSSATPLVASVTPIETIEYNTSYGSRFCMFAALRPSLTYYEVSIFSSFRSGDCSEEEYKKLSEASIMAQLRTTLNPQRIVKLGFHTNVASENLTARAVPYISVGASRFDHAGMVKINYLYYMYRYATSERFRMGVARAAYTPMANIAPLHFIYNPGSTVYELVSPKGNVFIMTSFTNYFNPKLSLTNLNELGNLLNLPPGWKFRSRVIDQIISLDATAPYYYSDVIFDDFQNFYVEVKL